MSRLVRVLSLALLSFVTLRATAAETLSERTLKGIVADQKAIIADATQAKGGTVQSDVQSQLQQICQRYDILLRDNPSFVPGYVAYGLLLNSVGMRRESAAMMTKANKLDGNIPVVKNQLGNYLAEQGKPLEAVNYYLAAIDLEPTQPLYHFQLATLLIEARDDFVKSGQWTAKNLDRAMIDGFRKASMLAPDDWRYAYRYGLAFYDLGEPQWGDALAFWKAFEEKLSPGLEQQICRLHQAKVLIEMKRRDDALPVLDTVTEPSLQTQKDQLIHPPALPSPAPTPAASAPPEATVTPTPPAP